MLQRIVKTFSGLSMVAVAVAMAVNHYRLAPLRGLVTAFDSQRHRTIEGRLTGGFAYRPVEPVTRGEGGRIPIFAAAAALQQTETTRHNLGISGLLLRDWDAALAVFHQALQSETQYDDPLTAIAASSDAALLSDVAAAYHAHARHRNEPRSYVIAAEAAQRAWAIDKTPETAWNRAITVAALHLREDALRAWSDYLAIDGDSEWANEARQRMRALSAPPAAAMWAKESPRLHDAVERGDEAEIRRIVQAFPNDARTLAENTYLSEWANGADRLPFCRAVGRALQETTGESMLADTVAHIDQCDADQRGEVALGLAVYGEGRAFYRQTAFDKAAPKLRDAFDILTRAGSPFASVARMYALSAEGNEDHGRVLAATDAWLRDHPFDERRHAALAGQLRWVRGIASLRLGRPQAAVEEYGRALAVFERLGELQYVALLHRNLSEVHDYLGDSRGAWRHRLIALEEAAETGDDTPHLLEAVRLFAAAALIENMPAVAVLCLDRVVQATDEPSRYDLHVTALLLRARAYRALGKAEAATADVGLARGLVSKIADPSVRARHLHDPQVVNDRLSATRDASEREKILADAIAYAKKNAFAIPLAQLYLEQGRHYVRLQQWTAAEAALFAGIDQIEGERVTIADAAQRASFLAARHQLYDTLVELLSGRGQHERAFDVVERGRARTLLELVAARTPGSGPASLARIRATLDAYTAIVEYAPVGDGLGVWLVTKSDVRFVTIDRNRNDLRRLAVRFRTALQNGDERGVDELSRELDDILIEPWYRAARPFERLVFVPDDALSDLPFAALHDGRSFLVERHTITTAPSANVLLACILRDRALPKATGTALVVAPSTSVGSAGDQALLAASQAEAIGVARQYRSPILLEGGRATRREFVERAPSAEIIHFAGHAVAERTGIPRLLFAAEANADAAYMHAEDIRAMRFDATRVVMLAACDTAAQRGSPGHDGVSSLARAFLAAGVPAVVGSYWPVDDEATARLSHRFHALLSRGQDPAAALRAAQLDMLASSDARSRRTGAWAAFALFGGTQTERR